jgi:hypothetical protein
VWRGTLPSHGFSFLIGYGDMHLKKSVVALSRWTHATVARVRERVHLYAHPNESFALTFGGSRSLSEIYKRGRTVQILLIKRLLLGKGSPIGSSSRKNAQVQSGRVSTVARSSPMQHQIEDMKDRSVVRASDRAARDVSEILMKHGGRRSKRPREPLMRQA